MRTSLSIAIIFLSFIGHGQTWEELLKINASDAAAGDDFGYAVAIDGDRAIVGANSNDDVGSNSGAAYIFEKIDDAWVEVQKITASDATSGDLFGISVGISGNYAIVGAHLNDEMGSNAGAAYIFEYDGASWTEDTKLIASDAAAGDFFGFSVSISGDNALVGARFENNQGAAYVFNLSGGTWSETTKLTASDANTDDWFGQSVCITGTHAIIGANQNDDAGINSGSAYIFSLSGGVWSEVQKLTASDEMSDDYFGWSVSISGERAVVGTILNDDAGSASGSVYVFELSGGVWSETQKLTASDAATFDYFGQSVSVSGDHILIGANRNDDDGADSGLAYMFKLDGGTWVESQLLSASDAAGGDFFGHSVAISGNQAIIGANRNDDDGSNSGSAYIFIDPTPCLASSSSFAIEACATYTVPSGDETYTTIGTYDVMDTIPNFCGADSVMTITVTIFGLPTVEANVVDDLTEICLEDEITLFGSGATSYSWDVLGVTDGDLYEPTTTGTTTYTVTGTDDNGCSNTASIDILVNELPTVTASVNDAEICIGDEVTFTGGGTADTYDWDEGVTDGDLYEPPATGTTTYTVTGTITATGCINTATVDVLVHELPAVTAGVDATEICLGDQVTFTGGGADTYTWDEGVIDGELFEPTTAGTTTYTITGTDGNGCVNTASVDVMVFALPEVIANADPENVCLGDEVTLSGSGAETYVWDLGIEDGVAFTPTEAGTVTHTVIGTDANGCVNDANIDVTTQELPDLQIEQSASEICLGEGVYFYASGADLYNWETPWGGSNDDKFMTQPSESGNYMLTVFGSSEYGCLAAESVFIEVFALPEVTASADTSIYPGESTFIEASSISNGTYLWSPGQDLACPTCNETETSPLSTRTYTITFTDENGCQATDQVVITLLDLIVETEIGISPNDDGDNDVLVFPGILAYPNSSIQIFNRWGVEVFTAENGYQNDWRGTDQNTGDLLPNNSTCFFVLDLGEEGVEPVKGYVYISY